MKIKINGKEIEIEDSDSLVIELERSLSTLSTSSSNIKNIVSNGDIGNIITGDNNIILNDNNYMPRSNKSSSVGGGLNVVINITGDVEKIDTMSGDVTVKGDSTMIKTMSGDVTVHNKVRGNIKTMSGDVDVKGNVGGKIDTMSGDIINRR